MLREILNLIESGDVKNLDEIAQKLNMDVTAIEGPFKLLLKKGYLKIEITDGQVKSGKCLMCSAREFCGADLTGKAYTITKKGLDYMK
jgi:predicted transcriptional regulator